MKKKKKLVWNSPVVLCFAALSFVVMVLNLLTGGLTNRLLFTTYRAPLTSPLTWIRFFTHVLGHAGWTHYIGNMSYLLLLGPMLEEKYGSKRILGTVAVTAVMTGAVNFLLFPTGSNMLARKEGSNITMTPRRPTPMPRSRAYGP